MACRNLLVWRSIPNRPYIHWLHCGATFGLFGLLLPRYTGPMNAKQWTLLLVLSLVWGGSFFFNAVLVRELGPITIAFGRTTLAAITLFIIMRIRRIAIPTAAKLWGQLAMMGLINNLLPFSLIAWGQRSVDSGLASILNATMPLWSVLLAHVLTSDEKLTSNKLLGVLLGLAGVVVLIGPEVLGGIGAQALGQMAVVGAAMCYAVAAIFGRRFRGMPSLIPAFGMLACTAVMSLPLALFVEQAAAVRPQAHTWLALLGLAIVSTAFAYILYFQLLAEAGATNASLVTLLIPLSALMLGIVFLDEQVSSSLLLGMGLIIGGLVAVDGRLLQRLFRNP